MPESEIQTWPIWTGRAFNSIQIWRDPAGMIVVENPDGLKQITFTAEQWARINEHVAGEPDGDAR